MQGIDISNWQQGLDLSAVPCDFAIMKATEGTWYTDPCCDGWVQQCIELGKPWGVYCYVNGGDAQAEADFFIDQCAGYVHHGLLCVDWESGGNDAWGDLDYLGSVVDRIIERTGVKPLIYASASVYDDVVSVADDRDCGLWIAQYANMQSTGHQDAPWNEGAYDCVIRQYASTGWVDGWDGALDLDKAYISAEQWAKYAAGDAAADEGDDDMQLTDMITDGTIMGETSDASVGNCLYWAEQNTEKILTEVAALSAAVEALAKAQGADPEAIAQTVEDAVKAKLDGLRLTVKAD